MADTLPHQRRIPPRVLVLSLLALAVPVVATVLVPAEVGPYGAFFWLLGLIPAFALSFYRGPGGVMIALAIAASTMVVTYAVAAWLTLPINGSLLFWVVLAFLVIALWIGVQAEFMHRERDAVERMAFTDALTGLPNRRHALMHLTKEFAAAQRGRAVTIVLFDLDHFKEYNDTYGHAAGDDALRAFGEVLGRFSRQMNLSGRLGGEEFISVLGGAGPDGAVIFANRVCQGLADLNLGDGPLTVSAGVASYKPQMSAIGDLLAAADEALYEAKGEGRNRVVVHTGPIKEPEESTARRRHRDAPREEGGEAVPGNVPAAQDPDAIGQGRTVLLVEPDAAGRRIISDFLRRERFSVKEAEETRGALRSLSADVDILVSDLSLPGRDASELVSAVKARWPHIQVVVMTGVEGTWGAGEALRAGADSYIVKPFGVPELRRHLVDALQRMDETAAPEPEAELEGEARTRAEQARATMIRGVMGLVEAAELRDPFRQGRSARVAAYAQVLARGVEDERSPLDPDRLALACRVMDVGKIAVPDPILNKKGALNEQEMARIRMHPRIGRQMLEPLLPDEMVLAVVNWHHERWDGDGYPDRLVGAAIPPEARVVALADTLDALTRPRAYREAVGWEDALAELRSGSGTVFDPGLIAFMNTVLVELKEIHDGAAGPDGSAPEGSGAVVPDLDG
jgi:diguanylate cyclase (GGDEF)-like protein